MDTSTAAFIATLVVGFLVLRWLIAPIPPHLPGDINGTRSNQGGRSASGLGSSSGGVPSENRTRRPVTDSMIEVVQTVAPQLTVGQIRMDLERSGSVELTIERFMETGTLPFPLREDPATTASGTGSDSHNTKPANASEVNLLVKYGIDADDEIEEEDVAASKDGYTLMSQRRKFMILNARKRLQQQLEKEQDQQQQQLKV